MQFQKLKMLKTLVLQESYYQLFIGYFPKHAAFALFIHYIKKTRAAYNHCQKILHIDLSSSTSTNKNYQKKIVQIEMCSSTLIDAASHHQ